MSTYAPPTRMTLLSHPATREQKHGILPGDKSLDAEALAELAAVTWRPAWNSRVLSSPELRTRQTADALRLTATQTPELRDCDFGTWSGRSLDGLEPRELSAWLNDIHASPHGGESFHQLMMRVGGWLDSQRDAGPTVVITHAAVIRAAIVHALELSPSRAFLRLEIGPLTLTDLRFTAGCWRVRSAGVPLI